MVSLWVLVTATLAGYTIAAPTSDLIKRQEETIRRPITNLSQLRDALRVFNETVEAGGDRTANSQLGYDLLDNIVPEAAPQTLALVEARVSIITKTRRGDFFGSAAELLLRGLAGGNLATILQSYTTLSNQNNQNLREPATPIFPSASPDDAPYSLDEATLRRHIHIPESFSFGERLPVLFIPGTGGPAGLQFGPNMGKLIGEQGVGDPVYVNIPNFTTGDIQLAAEYVAYATNYISGISGGRQVATIAWSQGSISGQWALKYWPSTRNVTADTVRISGDFEGTIVANLACPIDGLLTTPACTAAVSQQRRRSRFLTTLASDTGDSAYVPSTNIWSIFDPVVQPQIAPFASGSLGDAARGVGSTNVQLQDFCTALRPGGTPNNLHEGPLYNALTYALAVDALQNDGPADVGRVDTAALCSRIAAEGLSVTDVLATHATIPVAAAALLLAPFVVSEPATQPYAL